MDFYLRVFDLVPDFVADKLFPDVLLKITTPDPVGQVRRSFMFNPYTFKTMKYILNESLSPVEKNNLNNAYKNLNAQLTFVIQLSPNERRGLQTVADGRSPFLRKVYQLVKDDPTLWVSDVPIQDFFNDVETWEFMQLLEKKMASTSEKVTDTSLQAGAEGYHQARVFYQMLQLRAESGTPGLDAIIAELGKLYPGKKAHDPDDDLFSDDSPNPDNA